MKGKNWLLALTLFWCGATLADYTLDGTYRKLSPQYPDIVPIRLQPEDGVRHCQLPPIWRGPLSRADRRPARRPHLAEEPRR